MSGSSVVVAFLLESVAWYAAIQSARSVVGILQRAQRFRVIIVFVDLPIVSIVFSYFLSLSFGHECAACPSCDLEVVSTVAILI